VRAHVRPRAFVGAARPSFARLDHPTNRLLATGQGKLSVSRQHHIQPHECRLALSQSSDAQPKKIGLLKAPRKLRLSNSRHHARSTLREIAMQRHAVHNKSGRPEF
jgi:hypothetical protein